MTPRDWGRLCTAASTWVVVVVAAFVVACGGQSTPTAPVAQLAGDVGAVSTAKRGQPKVDICHFDEGSGTWRLLNIASAAVEAHLANHRDGLPNGEVPGIPGTIFDEDCVPADLGIAIEKSTNGQDADEPTGPIIPVNDPVNWEYVVTNTGEMKLVDVGVVDDQGVAVSCPKSELAPGESMTCTAAGTAVEGQYKNTGTATGSSCKDGTSVACNGVTTVLVLDSDDSHYLGESAQITCPVDVRVAVDLNLNPMPYLICGSLGHAIWGPPCELGPSGLPVTTDYGVSNGGRCLGSGIGFRGICDRNLGVPSGTGDSFQTLTPEEISACASELVGFATQLQLSGLLYPGSSDPASCTIF